MLKFLICSIFERKKKERKTIQFCRFLVKPNCLLLASLGGLSQQGLQGFSVLRTTEEKREERQQGFVLSLCYHYTLLFAVCQ
jgi:hypothetical protein